METPSKDIQHQVKTRAPKVVVVGAGFAGVGAVGALREGGIHDVTLLEACDRPGGRVKSVVMDKGFIELGAQYLHGKHEVYQIAEREGLLDEEDSDDEELPDTVLQYKDYVFRTSDGNTVCADTVDKNLELLESIMEAGKATEGLAQDVNVSFGDFFRNMYKDIREVMQGTEDLKTAMIRWFENWNCVDSAGKPDQLSLPGNCQYHYQPGSGTMETTTGMEDVLKSLVRDSVPPERLHVSKPVRAICWSSSEDILTTEDGIRKNKYGLNSNQTTDGSDNGRTTAYFKVRIECEDGEEFYADHVIVTPSIGFLAQNPCFFQPQLPPLHQKAISSIGFGDVAKIFLFWDEKDLKTMNIRADTKASDWRSALFGNGWEGMVPLWLPNTKTKLRSAKYSRKLSNGNHWYQEVAMVHTIETHEFCLVAWVAGEGAVLMESLPESEVKDVIHELLVLFMGKPDLPAPRRLVRTTWYSNPYTRGAYSYPATNVPLELRDVLRQPLPSVQKPVLQLAGEACSQYFYSTVHGALLSGQDAARKILRCYDMDQQ